MKGLMKTRNRLAAVNGHSSTPRSAKKKVKGFRIQFEFCPNQDIVIVHSRKKFLYSESESHMQRLTRKGKNGSFEKPVPVGNKHPLFKAIRRIKGVLKTSSDQYELHVEKASLFSWDEILPKVRRAIRKHYADGLPLDEAPAHRPSEEVLMALRLRGCDV